MGTRGEYIHEVLHSFNHKRTMIISIGHKESLFYAKTDKKSNENTQRSLIPRKQKIGNLTNEVMMLTLRIAHGATCSVKTSRVI